MDRYNSPLAISRFGSKSLFLWLALRLPILLLVLYTLRYWIIAQWDDPAALTVWVIEVAGTPATRAIFIATFAALLSAIWILLRCSSKTWAYLLFLLVAGCAMGLALHMSGTGKRASLLPTAIVVGFLATNLVPGLIFDRIIPTKQAKMALARYGVGISEVLFFPRHVVTAIGAWTGQPPPPALAAVRTFPVMVLAAAIGAMFLRVYGLVPIEQSLRLPAEAHIIERGSFNWIELDPSGRYLFAAGHGLSSIRRYDLQDSSAPPFNSPADTGNSQSFAFDRAASEIYVVNRKTRDLLVLDASSLQLKRTVAIPGLAYGDTWLAVDPRTDTITVSSEDDREVGDPLVVLDRKTGAIVARRALDPGHILLDPDRSLIYMSFFRRSARIAAFDLVSNSVVLESKAPPHADRMALLGSSGEVLLCVPVEGRVLRYDARDLRIKGEIKANFGVRVIAIDEQRHLMFAGSLATGEVAVVALRDGRLLRRFYLGPWIRTIQLDQQKARAFVSSEGALYSLDYSGIQQ